MKNQLFRIIMIVGFIAFSVYLLVPTWQASNYEKDLKKLRGNDSLAYLDKNDAAIREARNKRLKLGLDLQGGMYVTLEVDVLTLLEKLARNGDDNLRQILAETKAEAATGDASVLDAFSRKFDARGMRMSRYYGDIRDSNAEVLSMLRDETEKSIDRALQIIRNRIDKYGVSEVTIARSGSRRIVVELPGVSDEREVRRLIQETAQLEFKTFADPQSAKRAFDNVNRVLLGKPIEAEADTAAADTTALAAADAKAKQPDAAKKDVAAKKDTASKSVAAADAKKKADSASEAGLSDEQKRAKFERENPFTVMFTFLPDGSLWGTAEQKERINRVLARSDVRDVIPSDVRFAWSAKGRVFEQANAEYFEFFILKAKAELGGEVIENARAQIDPQGMGGAVVTMQMNPEGGREWARITGANVDKQIAIVLDNAVFSAPKVKQKIIGGNSQIDGMDNLEEARLLEIVLKAGALPAPVNIIEERTVGPSLGEDSINRGISSFFYGSALVVLFMMLYYRYSGFTADVAVGFNVLFILGILAGFGATLTLPGIAGILLTVGMAVDANVLINERIREEFEAGKTMRAAIDAGYARAFPAILDSNLTTMITSLVLYQLGTGPVQGFALTMIIGIVCTLFTAIIMTRVMLNFTLEKSPKLVTFG